MKIEIEHSVSKELAAILTAALASFNQLLNHLTSNQETIMADLSELQQEVEQLTDVVQSAVTLINGLSDEIKNLEPNQEAIDALASAIDAAAQNLANAVASNTPADPSTPPDPNAPQINPLQR